MSRSRFTRLFLRDMLGLNILRLIRSKKPDTDGVRDEFRRRHPLRGGYARRTGSLSQAR